jgi:hypothetical protein
MRLRYVFSLVTGNLPLPLDSNLEPGQFRCRDPFAERYCSACKMFRATMILCIQYREDAPVISLLFQGSQKHVHCEVSKVRTPSAWT